MRPATPGKRRVHFNESKNKVYDIYHVNDLSSWERARIWLQVEDCIEIKKRYTVIVRMMMKSKEPLEETDEICPRGLGE